MVDGCIWHFSKITNQAFGHKSNSIFDKFKLFHMEIWIFYLDSDCWTELQPIAINKLKTRQSNKLNCLEMVCRASAKHMFLVVFTFITQHNKEQTNSLFC